MRVTATSKYRREFKKLPRGIQEQIVVKEELFRKSPFHGSLRTHKLKGVLAGFWSFSVTSSHRIIFEFVSEVEVHFLSVGNHDVYRQ